jgi:hypothetical protein
VCANKTRLQVLERKYKIEKGFIEKKGLKPNWAGCPIPPPSLPLPARPSCGPSHLPSHHPPLVGKLLPGSAMAARCRRPHQDARHRSLEDKKASPPAIPSLSLSSLLSPSLCFSPRARLQLPPLSPLRAADTGCSSPSEHAQMLRLAARGVLVEGIKPPHPGSPPSIAVFPAGPEVRHRPIRCAPVTSDPAGPAGILRVSLLPVCPCSPSFPGHRRAPPAGEPSPAVRAWPGQWPGLASPVWPTWPGPSLANVALGPIGQPLG